MRATSGWGLVFNGEDIQMGLLFNGEAMQMGDIVTLELYKWGLLFPWGYTDGGYYFLRAKWLVVLFPGETTDKGCYYPTVQGLIFSGEFTGDAAGATCVSGIMLFEGCR